MSNKKKIASVFGGAAKRYDAAAVLQQEIARRLIDRLGSFKIKAKTIIDLGAGTGYFAQQLNPYYSSARVIGVDLAEGMLRYAQKQKSPLSLVCADAQYLPFASKTIDLVFSNLMLQWCPDIDQVFREVARILRPGGLFVFSTLGPDTLYELRESWAQIDNYQHVNVFTDMHPIGDSLLASNLLNPVVDRDYVTVAYDKVERLLRDLRDLGANQVLAKPSERMPGLLGKLAYQAFIKAYENFRDEKGMLPATYEVIYGHAWAAPKAGEFKVFVQDIKTRYRN
jgi:malonyl-CoA O-methyltransferase